MIIALKSLSWIYTVFANLIYLNWVTKVDLLWQLIHLNWFIIFLGYWLSFNLFLFMGWLDKQLFLLNLNIVNQFNRRFNLIHTLYSLISFYLLIPCFVFGWHSVIKPFLLWIHYVFGLVLNNCLLVLTYLLFSSKPIRLIFLY